MKSLTRKLKRSRPGNIALISGRGQGGFSLVEVMVTVTIMTILASISLQGMVAQMRVQKRIETKAQLTEDAKSQIALSRWQWLSGKDMQKGKIIEGCKVKLTEETDYWARLESVCKAEVAGDEVEILARGFAVKPVPTVESGGESGIDMEETANLENPDKGQRWWDEGNSVFNLAR